MSILPDRGCDPERIFELADGGLTPEQRREALSHIEKCPECREFYEQELELNARLGSLDFPDPGPCSVSRQVAMSLPTRPLKARALWAILAIMLLAVTTLSLGLGWMEAASLAMGVLTVFWGLAAGVADALRAVLDTVGMWALAALAIGAMADIILAAVIFSATRLARRV